MKEEKKFANEIELICAINSTMNRQSQLDCITSAGRPNFPIYKALILCSKFKNGLSKIVTRLSLNSMSLNRDSAVLICIKATKSLKGHP